MIISLIPFYFYFLSDVNLDSMALKSFQFCGDSIKCVFSVCGGDLVFVVAAVSAGSWCDQQGAVCLKPNMNLYVLEGSLFWLNIWNTPGLLLLCVFLGKFV